MTQEQKELLLRDLCARLPYGVKCEDTNINVIGTLSQIGLHYDMCVLDKDDGNSESCYIPNCKPYLFPMSSMTEEQEIEYDATFATIVYEDGRKDSAMTYKTFDWLNKNHFDYRGLIPMGLAKDATGLNIY
jgi:hypothetical protein